MKQTSTAGHLHMLSPEARLVQKRLQEAGLETPLVETPMDNNQKYERIKGLMTEVLSTLGLD
jgi:GTP cyclohydrolase I